MSGVFEAHRRRMQEKVHETFAVSAVVYPVSASIGYDVEVRCHNVQELIGELNREGYAQAVADVETMVFTRADVEAYAIRKGALVKLTDGRAFTLEDRRQTEGLFDVVYDVTRAKA